MYNFFDAYGCCMRCTTGAVFCLFSAKGVTGSMAYDTMLATFYTYSLIKLSELA